MLTEHTIKIVNLRKKNQLKSVEKKSGYLLWGQQQQNPINQQNINLTTSSKCQYKTPTYS